MLVASIPGTDGVFHQILTYGFNESITVLLRLPPGRECVLEGYMAREGIYS